MHAISLHLILHAFAATLIWWELNFNMCKFLGNCDPAFAVAEHHPLLVYLRVQSFRSKLHALQICLCMIGRKSEGHVVCKLPLWWDHVVCHVHEPTGNKQKQFLCDLCYYNEMNSGVPGLKDFHESSSVSVEIFPCFKLWFRELFGTRVFFCWKLLGAQLGNLYLLGLV
jgi:hypothetical protein